MCGLVAALRRGRPVDDAAAVAALRSILHRGPDGHALEHITLAPPPGSDAPAVHVAMGHARLAILDPRPRSDQPFTLGHSTLVYNGEIYNFRDIAGRLRGAGVELATTGDTEVLLRVLERDGPAGLAAANGMWALCWLDRRRRRLVAIRDRYGKKPLFYCRSGDSIAFASELRAVLALSGRRPVHTPGSVEGFINEGWLIPRADGHLHIEGVQEVRPGHALEIDLDSWTMSERALTPIECGEAGRQCPDEELAATLADAAELRLVSDRRVGLMLSGGVDSSLVLSVLAARGLAGQVTCITGDAGKSEDAAYARRALEQLGLPSLQVPLDYSATGFEQFLAVCRHQEKPFPLIGNALGLPALYRAASDSGIRVVLDGTGADEVFGGYWTRHAAIAMRDAARAGDEAWLDGLRAGGQVQGRLAEAGRTALMGPLIKPLVHRPGARELAYLRADARHAVETAAVSDPLVGFAGNLGEALARDATAGRMQDWLWQNDRNAMASGVENRSPFLDHRLARWMATGYAAKFGGQWNKLELRRIFDRFRPLATGSRVEKQGFRWVYGRFMRANRAAILDIVASSTAVRRLLDGDRLLVDAGAVDDVLECDLMQRLMVVAGLEATGAMAPV